MQLPPYPTSLYLRILTKSTASNRQFKRECTSITIAHGRPNTTEPFFCIFSSLRIIKFLIAILQGFAKIRLFRGLIILLSWPHTKNLKKSFFTIYSMTPPKECKYCAYSVFISKTRS